MRAQDASVPPTPAARAEARRVASRATHAYDRRHFEEALAGYARAYALYPAPGLLFNMGQCQRELRRNAEAIELFERFVRERPDAPNVHDARDLIAELRAATTGAPPPRDDREQAAALVELERARRALEEARQAGAERYQSALAELERARSELETARRRDAEHARLRRVLEAREGRATAPAPALYERWWFWTIVAGVVVATAGAITIGVLASPDATLPAGSLGTINFQ